MIVLANNYLEHEDEVKLYENYLNRSKDWQEFIDLIEENFELNEIYSFKDFLDQFSIISRVTSYFLKIIECNPNKINFKNHLLYEVYSIAEYYLGKKELSKIKELLSCGNNLSKLLLLITWVTKLENYDNKTEYLFDLTLLTKKNAFILLKIDEIQLNENEIFQYFDTIKIDNMDKIKTIFKDNVNKEFFAANSNFLEENKSKIIHENAFFFNINNIEKTSFSSWEEEYIIDMLNISFDNRKIIPIFSSGSHSYPDFSRWTEDILNHLKIYFNSCIADFVIDTIWYILFDKKPSDYVISKHIELFINNFKISSKLNDKYNNSSFKIISYMLKDKILSKDNKRELMKELSTIEDKDELILLKDNDFYLTRNQKNIVSDYLNNCFKDLDHIDNFPDFLAYLSNKNNVISINNEYLKKAILNFNKYICSDNIPYSNLFIEYMLFLTKLNNNPNVDKEHIKHEMIRVQTLWEEKYYYICTSKLTTFEHEEVINNKYIEEFNKKIVDNIFSLANICTFTKTQQYINAMELTSENVFSSLATNISLNKFFPLTDEIAFDFDNHDIDKLTLNIIDHIKEKYGYKFLNTFDSKIYLREIHKTMIQYTRIYISFFNKENELYEIIQTKLKDKFYLIELSDNVQLAHLTQLFPIVEILIKEIGKIYNVFPFKEDEKQFMKSKDPSSILRIMLQKCFDEIGSFDAAPDLLFVYHYLYNSNSLNIRNECIHGRNYLSGDSLLFGFKVTLCALYMLIKRFELITSKDN